jgi:PhnB protein
MSKLHAYLLFDGTCAEAMQFYAHVLGGTIESLTRVGDSPMAAQFPPEKARRVIHARLRFGDNVLMASDWMVAQPYSGIKGTRLTLVCAHPEEAKHVFDAMTVDGHTEMPLQKTAWAAAFGMLVDQYGAPWQVMTE